MLTGNTHIQLNTHPWLQIDGRVFHHNPLCLRIQRPHLRPKREYVHRRKHVQSSQHVMCQGGLVAKEVVFLAEGACGW
jgi:hypothetical protein